MAEKVIEKVYGEEFQGLDFSKLHDILLLDDDGVTTRPFDTIYMRSVNLAPGVWQMQTTGDYTYLIEGDDEAIVIDTGFGLGNLRKMAQTLTDKPIRNCYITHEHPDHIGGICYYEKAFMSEPCAKVSGKPTMRFPYSEVEYPDVSDKIEIIHDGDVIDLGGRQLEVMHLPDHAAGSLMFLDKANRILFSGDELGTPAYKAIGTTVEQYYRNISRLFKYFHDIDWCFGGGFVYDNMLLFRQKQCLERILDGDEDVPYAAPAMPVDKPDPLGRRLHNRRLPDQKFMIGMLRNDMENKRQMTYGYCTIVYKKDCVFDRKD